MTSTESELEFGTTKCVCPKCGFTVSHAKRGIPCSERKCPKCGAKMKGEKCAGV
jgi:rubrerythrin